MVKHGKKRFRGTVPLTVLTDGDRIKDVAVVGAGVTGMSAALTLAESGYSADVFEKEEDPGGHVGAWHSLFPGGESARDLMAGFRQELVSRGIRIRTGTEVTAVDSSNGFYTLQTTGGGAEKFRSVLVSTGYRLFDASRKEEYGYGVYPYVITSAELEKRLEQGDRALLVGGMEPGKVAFVHCVGSRDSKAGNLYCSRVCCITGVKQAIAVKELYPDCEVLNFYMDLRMYGVGYEELYQKAQEHHGIQFIRGRVSEAAPTRSGAIQVKAEDTLLGVPLKTEVDWLVLLVGMEPADGTARITGSLDIARDSSGFLRGKQSMVKPWAAESRGIFIAGACCGPATVPESVTQGRAAAVSVVQYLSGKA